MNDLCAAAYDAAKKRLEPKLIALQNLWVPSIPNEPVTSEYSVTLEMTVTAARPTEAGSFSSKAELGGVGYSRDTSEQLYAAICQWLRGDRTRTRTVGYVNPHVFNIAKRNSGVRRFLAQADIVAVDGLGFALAAWLLKRERQTRTVVTPLFDRVLATDDLPFLTATLIGSTESVLAKGAAAMNRAARRIKIVKTCDGYQPLQKYVAFLKEAPQTDLVLIAMGTPRSEELMLEAAAVLSGKFLWNIGGGTLHFYAGTQPRVPRIVSALGTQWLWRIAHEPKIAPRYLIGIPVFFRHLLQIVKNRSNPR